MQMLVDLLLIASLSLTPATFGYFLDYAIGQPGSDHVNTKAILFPWALWLAKKRLPEKKERELVSSFSPMLNSDDPDVRQDGQDQFKLSLFMTAKKYFHIEFAFGMCMFCTNFWISQIAALILFFSVPLSTINPLLFFLLVPIFSHTILRKL